MGRFDEIPGGAPSHAVHNAVFWLHDGVMFGKHLPGEANVTLEDVIQVFQKLKEMTGGERTPFLFDGRGLRMLNIDTRAYIRANAPDVFTHAAVVVKSDLVLHLSHAILGIAGMDMPVRLFTDEEEAWSFATHDRSDAA